MPVLDAVDERAIGELTARRELFWLDLAEPDERDLSAIAPRLGWHPLALEDTRELDRRPKPGRCGDDMPLTALTGCCGQNLGWLVRHVDALRACAAFGVGGAAASCAILSVWLRRSRFTD